MNLLQVTVLAVACAVPGVGWTQWQWIDKDGRKVFSDQSPPNDIPAKNILKRPGAKQPEPVAEAVAATASSPSKPAAAGPKLTGKDKELEDKKKLAEAAEAEKKKAQAEELAKLRADNCVRAKRTKATFDSGIRITRTNDKGEREIMDDAARAVESKRIDGIIASDCKPAG